MTLSPLQIKLYATLALAAALIVFEFVTRMDDRQKIKSGEVKDQREHDTLLVKHNAVPYTKGRIWAEGLLIVATGIMVAVTAMSVIEYQKYGAFYDASWRSPDVEQHFLFDSKSNQDLEAQWLSDPENFPWAEARICFVKLGCEDCERVEQAIHDLEAEGYAVVFSTSEFGRAAVEKYGVTYVPSVVVNGFVVQLRPGAGPDQNTDQDAGTKSDGAQTQEILDDLMSGGLATDENGEDPALDPDYTKYGTKAAIEWAMEQEQARQKNKNQAQEPEN